MYIYEYDQRPAKMVQKSSHIGCNYIGSLRGKNPAKMGNAASQNGSIDFDRF